jgi:hypothetical protein
MKKSQEVKFKVVEVRSVARRIPLEEKVCAQCGTRFLGSKTRLYCSRSCTQKARYWRNPDVYRQKRLEGYRKAKGEGPGQRARSKSA